MKVLIVTAMYPTPDNPAYGSFIRTQVESLKRAGVDAEVLVLEPRVGKLKYIKGVFQLRRKLAHGSFDLVHAHFGYVGMVARTRFQVPVVVTFHGDDLLGQIDERGRTNWLSAIIAKAGALLARSVEAAIVQSAAMAAKI